MVQKVKALLWQERNSAVERAEKLKEVSEDLKAVEKRILYKEKCRDQAEAGRNYGLCEELTTDIMKLRQQKRELQAQERIFQRKEKQAIWYHNRKVSCPKMAPSSPSDSESEKSVQSPSSSHSTVILSGSESDPEQTCRSWQALSPQPISSPIVTCR